MNPSVELITCDCEELTKVIEDHSIDIVLNIESGFFYPNFERFLRQVHTVIKDDGVFLYEDHIPYN